MNHASSIGPRAWLAVGLFAATALSAFAADDGSDDRMDGGDGGASEIRRGYELVPPGVKLNLFGKNRALVGRGSYIVNTSACIDCHSHPTYAPGGDPFKGEPEMIDPAQYLSGGRQFGPFTAPNLTPDHAGKPAGLTRQQFINVLRTGHDPKDPPGDLLQVMPWPSYGKKTERDLIAIYEYLRAIPPLPDNPHPGP